MFVIETGTISTTTKLKLRGMVSIVLSGMHEVDSHPVRRCGQGGHGSTNRQRRVLRRQQPRQGQETASEEEAAERDGGSAVELRARGAGCPHLKTNKQTAATMPGAVAVTLVHPASTAIVMAWPIAEKSISFLRPKRSTKKIGINEEMK